MTKKITDFRVDNWFDEANDLYKIKVAATVHQDDGSTCKKGLIIRLTEELLLSLDTVEEGGLLPSALLKIDN